MKRQTWNKVLLLAGGIAGGAEVALAQPQESYPHTLTAHPEKLENVGFAKWMDAHYTLGKPLHQEEGTLQVTASALVFEGMKESWKIDFTQIIKMSYAFDEVITPWKSRQLNIKPLRIDYMDQGQPVTIYLYTHFSRTALGSWQTRNKILYQDLQAKIK